MNATPEFDRDAVIDHALTMFLSRGFQHTTLDDIADAVGISAESLRLAFATTASMVIDVVDAMLASVVIHLAEGEQDEDLVDALSRAHKAMLDGVIAGNRTVPLHRMQQVGLLAMASRPLAAIVTARRKETLTLALADHYGMKPDDPLIVRTMVVWSAVIAGTYAAGVGDHADVEPDRDLHDTKRMTRRLNHAFEHITGRRDT